MANIKTEKRTRRHTRIRSKVAGTAERPRLALFRSNKQIYAQIINDVEGITLAAAHSLKLDGKTSHEKAETVAKDLAKAAKGKGITEVVFDRGGFLYAGNVKLFAETARAEGLIF